MLVRKSHNCNKIKLSLSGLSKSSKVVKKSHNLSKIKLSLKGLK